LTVRPDRTIPSPDTPTSGQKKPTDRSPERPRLGVLSIEPSQSGRAERGGHRLLPRPALPAAPAAEAVFLNGT
jgi:hypothetical protein